MRIVYLHQYFNTRSSASGTRSYEMARRLVADGHEVSMITTDRDQDAPSGWVVDDVEGIRVHRIGIPYANRMGIRERVRSFARFAWAASRRAGSIPADLVFATSTPLTIALPAVRAARKQDVPMVFEVRDLWPELPVSIGALRNPALIAGARALERFAYRNAARVIALSPGMRDGVVRAGYPAERVTVVPNGCDIDLFGASEAEAADLRSAHPWLGSRPLVLYAGTLGRINGVDYLVRVAEQVRDTDDEIRFVIIGSGAEENRVRELARTRGLLDRSLFMLPRVPKTELAGWLGAADVSCSLFVDLPAMWSNSANKFFDALAAGTPPLINYGGWQVDVLERAGAGFRVPAADPRRAAEELVRHLRDRERLAGMGARARGLAEQEFARDVLYPRFRDALEQALAREGRSPAPASTGGSA